MKHCPACNFSFPDFHRVCDFDGSELVSDPERKSLVKLPPQPEPRRPSLKSPMLWTSLAVLGVFASAVAIGYLESPPPSIPAVTNKFETRNSDARLADIPKSSTESTGAKKAARTSKRMTRNRDALVVSANARLRQTVADNRFRIPAVAQEHNVKRSSGESSPKLVAILKTTWKVLKKPFDF